MAERRMFHSAVVESDAFLELPLGAQALYFHLGMHADDDGFVNGAKRICRKLGKRSDALKLLIDAGFLMDLEGIVVIKHWRKANILRNDRLKPLNYPALSARLYVTQTKEYSLEPQRFSMSLYDLRQKNLSDKCPPKGTEEKGIEENITEQNISSAPDGGYSDTLAYIRQLQARKGAEQPHT